MYRKAPFSNVSFGVTNFLGVFTVAAALATVSAAQVVKVPSTPQVGSSNPASAEPLVARPKTTPCIVPLLTNQAFADFNGKPMSYAPPAACPGPWAKVVFTADFTVTAGRQFDRTAEFYLGNANIYYGTTAEPRRTLSPSWHVERDLTDLTALFKTAQTGQAEIGNVVNSTYTGIIYGSAALEFYPVGGAAPVVPDMVVPIGSGNDAGTLSTGASQITQALHLPRNVEQVYLDVIAQSQSGDEFWYFCVPDELANTLESCGKTAFRETEITIDGKAAGVAPVSPWIYTGGIDPYLWEPIVGVQTLSFKPYRVNLTPFAGLLADGAAHTIGIGVYNANSYFLATANLLVYTDHGGTQVNGALTRNTLTAAPVPVVTKNLTTTAGTTSGTVNVGSNRTFVATGYVSTSHGQVETTISQTVRFLSAQQFEVNGDTGLDVQNMVQTSTVDTLTTTQEGRKTTLDLKHFSFPLNLQYKYVVNSDGTQTQIVTSDQQNVITDTQLHNGAALTQTSEAEEVYSTDTLQFSTSGAVVAAGIGNSAAVYSSVDSQGKCYSRTLTAANQVLTSVTDSKTCR